MDYKLWIIDYRLEIRDYGLWIMDYGLQIADYGLEISLLLQITDCRLWIMNQLAAPNSNGRSGLIHFSRYFPSRKKVSPVRDKGKSNRF